MSGGTGFRNIRWPSRCPTFPGGLGPRESGIYDSAKPDFQVRPRDGSEALTIIGFPEPEATQRVDPLEISYHSAQVYRLDARITPRRAASVHVPGLGTLVPRL